MNLQDYIASASAETGLPANFIAAQIQQESSGRPHAVSPAGAIGLMQILPEAHPRYQGGMDPEQNIKYGTKYMNDLLRRFRDPAQAIAAYNAGPGRVRRLVSKHGENWLQHAPEETRNYVANLLPVYEQSLAEKQPVASPVPPAVKPAESFMELKARVEKRQREEMDFKERRALEAQVAEAQLKDPPTFGGEALKAVWGAGVDLATEATVIVNDVAHTILPYQNLIAGAAYAAEAPWGDKWEGFNQGFGEGEADYQADKQAFRAAGQSLAPRNETFAGNMGRGILQFLVPYVGWAKAAGTANTFRAATARGFVIDATLFDPNQGNLSSLIKELSPETQNVVLDFLATDPDDDEALNRLRNGLEGAVLGTVLEGIFRVARFARGKKEIDEAMEAADKVSTKPDAEVQNLKEDAKAKVVEAENAKIEVEMEARAKEKIAAEAVESEPELVVRALEADAPAPAEGFTRLYRGTSDTQKFDDVFNPDPDLMPAPDRPGQFFTESKESAEYYQHAYNKNKDARIDYVDVPTSKLEQYRFKGRDEFIVDTTPKAPAPKQATVIGPDGAEKVVTLKDLATDLRSSLKLTDEARFKLNQMIDSGDLDGALEVSKDFNFATVDWSKVESADDIKALIVTTEKIFADHIDNVKGGVQDHATTKRLANLVGVTGEQVHKLYGDLHSDKGITARFLAAYRTMMASAAEAHRLLVVAKANPNDLGAKAAFIRQMHLHAALQAEVKGAQTEIARALNGMKIIKDEMAEGFKEFDTILRTFGKKSESGSNFEKFMDDLLDGKNLDEINAKVRQASGQERIRNVIVEYVINAMLSSPKTHLINFTSNVLNTFLYTGDRYISGVARLVLKGDRAALREANIDLMRKFGSLDEAFKLARQAWKDGAPVSDKRQRIEFQTRKAISMDGDTWLAKSVNFLGTIVRLPGRALITGDEFFKTINRNSEVAVLAYRKADELAEKAGLKYGSKAYKDFVAKKTAELANPDNFTPAARDIRSQAIEKSRLVTFQEAPHTAGGALLERLINHNALVKLVIAPFFRTPMNILRQGVLDRTPLGLLMKETRAQLANGSPRVQAEIMARMTTGVAAMAGFWAWAGTGVDSKVQIVGKVPFDSSEKVAGVLDYSIRIGDKWYQFNRLDPLGMWLGMVADAKMAAEHAEDDEIPFALMQGAIAGFMNNVTNKTWAKSLSDIYDLLDGLQSAEPAAYERAIGKFGAGQLGKFIPQIVKSVGTVALEGDERIATESWTLLDGLIAQIPRMRENQPPRHDALGRVVAWDNSWHTVLNPFAISDAPTSPVEQELARLDFTLRPMPKNYGGGLIDLTAEEYSELTGLVGSIKLTRHGNLEETLNHVITTREYVEGTDMLKTYIIKKHIEAARSAARLTFLSNPEFKARFLDTNDAELAALMGE